jgi:hypothetical protein
MSNFREAPFLWLGSSGGSFQSAGSEKREVTIKYWILSLGKGGRMSEFALGFERRFPGFQKANLE